MYLSVERTFLLRFQYQVAQQSIVSDAEWVIMEGLFFNVRVRNRRVF
jgi:hypothetical protein